jgi:hypothetical protein
MSGFSSFALFGVGRLGTHILVALLSHPAASQLSIRILTRPGSASIPVALPRNVSIWPIDYSRPEVAEAQLIKALTGVEVVISTVGSGLGKGEDVKSWADAGKHVGHLPGFVSQSIVARAAKHAGCQLFVPASALLSIAAVVRPDSVNQSEFGSPTHLLDPEKGSFVRGKKVLQDELRHVNLPWMLLYAVRQVWCRDADLTINHRACFLRKSRE